MSVTAAQPGFLPRATLRRFTVAEYHWLIDQGFLTDEDKVELLNGYMVLKMPRNPPHDSALAKVGRRLDRLAPAGWQCRQQSAVTFLESQPEPDVVLARGGEDEYDARHPGSADIGLVVEVSNTSLDYDRTDKGSVYAGESIPVYWIVNVVDRQIEVYTDPTGPVADPVYRRRQDYLPGSAVEVVLDGVRVGTVAVDEVLG
jgi:Uma2 family endonuclease